jgi:hypothetical protein
VQNTHLKTDSAGVAGDLYVSPFQLESQAVLKSALNLAFEAKTTVYCVVPGQMSHCQTMRMGYPILLKVGLRITADKGMSPIVGRCIKPNS